MGADKVLKKGLVFLPVQVSLAHIPSIYPYIFCAIYSAMVDNPHDQIPSAANK